MAGLLFFRIFGIHGDGSDPLRGLRPRAAGAASPPLPRPLRRRGVLPFTGSVFPPALVGSFHPILPDMQRREWTAWRRTGACCARGVGIARRPGCPPAEPEPRQAAGEASAHPGQMPADCRFHPGPPPPWAPDGRKGSAGPPARLSSPGRGPFRPHHPFANRRFPARRHGPRGRPCPWCPDRRGSDPRHPPENRRRRTGRPSWRESPLPAARTRSRPGGRRRP